MTDQNGLLVWEKESDRVDVMAVKKIDPFEAAKDNASSRKTNKKLPGEYYRPKLKLLDSSGEWPTYEEWVINQIKIENDLE